MAMKYYNPPEICNILTFIDKDKEQIQFAICDFYSGLFERIEWTNYDEALVIANGIIENRDTLLEILEKHIVSLESKVMRIPQVREEIEELAEKKLDIRHIDQPDSESEDSADSE